MGSDGRQASTRHRLRGSVLALLVAAFTLSACGAGSNPQTSKQDQAGVGADDRSGPTQVLGTLLVANADGSATVSAGVVNKNRADLVLTGVTVAAMDGSELPVRSTKFLLPLPHGGLARLGEVADAGGYIVIKGAETGRYLRVTLSFSAGKAITLEAPVVARTSTYDNVAG